VVVVSLDLEHPPVAPGMDSARRGIARDTGAAVDAGSRTEQGIGISIEALDRRWPRAWPQDVEYPISEHRV
jgi:hypothetical protein